MSKSISHAAMSLIIDCENRLPANMQWRNLVLFLRDRGNGMSFITKIVLSLYRCILFD